MAEKILKKAFFIVCKLVDGRGSALASHENWKVRVKPELRYDYCRYCYNHL